MGVYIDQSDVEDLWGAKNVLVWSDLDGDGSINTARITQSIAYAENRINNRFRQGRYAIPFAFNSGTDPVVQFWAAAYAGEWLYRSRGQRDEDGGERIAVVVSGDPTRNIKGVEGEIREYLSGQAILDAVQVETQPNVPTAVILANG